MANITPSELTISLESLMFMSETPLWIKINTSHSKNQPLCFATFPRLLIVLLYEVNTFKLY